MGLLAKTTSFEGTFVVCPTFLCMIGSPKITISCLSYKPREDLITRMRPREDLITRMRDHEKLGPYSKLRTL